MHNWFNQMQLVYYFIILFVMESTRNPRSGQGENRSTGHCTAPGGRWLDRDYISKYYALVSSRMEQFIWIVARIELDERAPYFIARSCEPNHGCAHLAFYTIDEEWFPFFIG